MCEVLGESRTCSLDHLGSAKCGLGHDKFYGRGLLAIAAETSEIRERSIHGDIQLSQLDDTGAPPKVIVIGCIFGGPTIAIFVCWCCCGDQPMVVFLLGIISDPWDPQVFQFSLGFMDGHSPNHGELL